MRSVTAIAIMSWFLTNILAAFLLPPLSLLLLLGGGVFLLYRRSRYAKPLLLLAFCLLWLCATPYFAETALQILEARAPQPQGGAQAIVILGGGSYFHAPEYGGADTVSEATLVRLRHGAKLWRETGLPILVTGGKPLGNSTSEAWQMRESLEKDFAAQVRFSEEAADNTYENARYSFQMLQKAGIGKILLVTHAWHMPRAARVFRSAGFEVVEAPTAHTTRYRIDLLAFVPNADALRNSRFFVHELVGALWYRLRSAFSNIASAKGIS